jgi:quinol-cytochrome oxidoreductase complex cytochrome b subunit
MQSEPAPLRQRLRAALTFHRGGAPRRSGRRRYLNNLALHFRPTTVPAATLRLSLSWGLGGMAAVLVLTQLVSGGLLNFVYEPIPTRAYESVLTIQTAVAFGKLVRNMHHWGANLLIIVAGLHLLRVIFTAACYPPRRLTWFIGLGLMALVLGANFTGYLLPYDQLAYWAVTICTGMLDYVPWLGGLLKTMLMVEGEIGPSALKLFYTLHTTVLPTLFVLLMAYHFWRVRKAGGLVLPPGSRHQTAGEPPRVATVPHLIVRELAVAAVLMAVLLLLAVVCNAPLNAPANPGLSPNPTKAPWYFAGLQELLLHFPPLVAINVIPALAMLLLAALPFAGKTDASAGTWFGNASDRRWSAVAALAGVALTLVWVLLDEYRRVHSRQPANLDGLAVGELVFGAWMMGLSGLYWVLRRRTTVSRHGAIQAVLALLISAFMVLTLIGFGFRGPGMRLIWPGG